MSSDNQYNKVTDSNLSRNEFSSSEVKDALCVQSGSSRRNFLKNAALMSTSSLFPLCSLASSPTQEQEHMVNRFDNKLDEIYRLDATAQAQLVRNRDISAVELVEMSIRRIEILNEKLNFLAGHDYERSIDAARKSDQSGIFPGVPILLKDTLSYPGIRYSVGSRLFRNRIATEGSKYTNRIDNAGFIAIGKSTVSEFAMLGSVETLLDGITRNPWNLEFSPAGSSGGSAAAVAAGAVPIAHASDGGGSIRIPASVNGLFGLKPSRGRTVADSPDGAHNPGELVSQHALTRTVRDSAQFLAVTERRDIQAPLKAIGYVKAPLNQQLRIAFYTKTLFGKEPDEEVKRAAEEAAALCASLGHQIIPTTGPDISGDDVSNAFFTIAGHNLSEMESLISHSRGKELDEKDLENFVLGLIEWYRMKPKGSFKKAEALLHKGAIEINKYFEKYDLSLCPTLPLSPQKIGYFSQSLTFDQLIKRMQNFAGYTPIHNQAGVPGMSVPLYWTEDGLPIGSHFSTHHGGEDLLLRLAYQLEEAKPWDDRWPEISTLC